MAKPESIEALLSPSLRVSRPVAACARCRNAKIKCDGKLPACSACERAGKADSCTASNDEFARGKERSYVAALEAASERLRKRIGERRAVASPISPASPGHTLSTHRRRDDSVVDELVGDLGFLSINATSRDFHGFTAMMSFARLVMCGARAAELPRYGPSPLPPRYATIQQIQHYLDNIYVLMPFLSETELMASLARVYESPGRSGLALDHWCVHMVLAISAGSSSQCKGDANHDMALRHVSAALEIAEEVLHPGSITGVQALLLLVQYSMVDPEHFRSWYLIGMASRLMVDLGFHVEPASELKMSKHALEMRRRVFYSVFALDRAISMSYERAFSFTDDSAPEVHLPIDSDKDAAPELFRRSIRPSSYLFDIRRVQSVFYQATRSSSRNEWPIPYATDYIASILHDVHSWEATIPTTLSQRHILYFRLEALYTQIMVLSPSIRVPISNMNDSNKLSLFELTFQYIDQLQPVTQDVSWHAFLTYTDIQRVKFVTRQFTELLQSNFDQLLCSGLLMSPAGGQSPNSALTPFTPLETCTRTIDCMRKMAEILDFARQRWRLSGLREGFEKESAVLLGKLKSRRQELNSVQGLASGLNFRQVSPNMPQAVPALHGNYNYGVPTVQDSTMAFPDDHSGPSQHGEFLQPTTSPDGLDIPPFPTSSLPRRGYEFFGRQSG